MILNISSRFILCLTVFCFFSVQNSFAQWIQLNSGVVSSFHALYFINQDTGFVIGDIVMKTEDGGITWSQIPNIWGDDVFFVNDTTGYVAGDEFIFKTIDRGNSWVKIYTNISGIFLSTFFINADTGYVGGQGTAILQTNDGGGTWVQNNQSLDFTYYKSIFFPTVNIGFAVGTYIGIASSIGIINKTTDGGKNWVRLTSFSNYEVDKELFTVFFTDSLNGWIGGTCYAMGCTQRIFRTTDGGMSWDTVSLLFYYEYAIRDISFVTKDIGYAVGDSGSIYKTKNEGITWQLQISPLHKAINKIHCVDANICYAVGDSGLILKTVNGGETSIKELPLKKNDVFVYPNPFNNIIFFEYNVLSASVKIEILNVFGKKVFEKNPFEQGVANYIDLSHLQKGVYFLKIFTTEDVRVEKVVVE